MIPKMNLHNHTNFSDGAWSPFEIIQKACDENLDIIGISDHLQTTKTPSVKIEDLPNYIEHIENLKAQFKNKIKVVSGIEIDSCPDRSPFVRDLSSFLHDSGSFYLDYVLVEYIGDPLWDGLSLDEFIKIRNKWDKTVGLAHWNPEYLLETLGLEKLVKSISESDLFIEITSFSRYNRNGISPFERERPLFKRLAELGVKFAVGSDTHDDLDDVARITNEINYLEDLGANIVSFDDKK